MKKKIFSILSLILVLCCVFIPGMFAKAYTIYDSPYVSFSPDGNGWTVQAGEKEYTHYPEETSVSTGIASSLRDLEVGEHYYTEERYGSIPIGKWVVKHRPAQCIHDGYPSGNYLGLSYGTAKCESYYNSGWIAYCADCYEEIEHMYVYMSKEAAQNIDYMECGIGLHYYHLCPHCNNLEMGHEVDKHKCKAISWNQYKIKYDENDVELISECFGSMQDSIHMYNNATEYEGKEITPVTHLSRNQYYCNGYIFTGWNTQPDGSGDYYADGAEIFNLTVYDWNIDGALGEITLYAQWQKTQSNFRIDPADGRYNDSGGDTFLTQDYGTRFVVDDSLVDAPDGCKVSFETNGGTEVDSIWGTTHFTHWSLVEPFVARFINNTYFFMAPNGHTDIICANYAPDSIILPGTEKENYSFGGWYYDEAFTKPAGGVGDKITPTEDITLYAQWVNLRLYSEDNYTDNGGKGAVDLNWELPDNKHKTYRIYQSAEQGMDEDSRKEITSASDSEKDLTVKEEFSYTGREETYTVPYSGFYQLTAYGAQGEDYGEYSGGKGGMVTGTFYLKAGDTLKYIIGGQGDTTTGGGAASRGGKGGGYTRVSVISDGVETLLLVAGGGGGASDWEDGLPGGSTEQLGTDGVSEGQSGMSGGGGGYVGGAVE